MKFRQRVAWLFLCIFLALTVTVVYYVFEIHSLFKRAAQEHLQSEHKGDTHAGTFLEHATHLPLPVWIVILLLPYLQVSKPRTLKSLSLNYT